MTVDRFEALNKSYKDSLEIVEMFSRERDEMWKKHTLASRDFNVAMLAEMRTLGPIQVRTMAALRSELGLETDMALYMGRLEENWAIVDKELKATMDKIAEG